MLSVRKENASEDRAACVAAVEAASKEFARKWTAPLTQLKAEEDVISAGARRPRCTIRIIQNSVPKGFEGALVSSSRYHIVICLVVNKQKFAEMQVTFDGCKNSARLAYINLLYDIWSERNFALSDKRGESLILTWTHVVRVLYKMSNVNFASDSKIGCWTWAGSYNTANGRPVLNLGDGR